MYNEFLKNLKIGDKVIIQTTHRSEVVNVSRITKTKIIVLIKSIEGDFREVKYNKVSGYLCGSTTWTPNYLQEYTEEKANAIVREKKINILKRMLENVSLDDKTDDELKSLYYILESFQKEKK